MTADAPFWWATEVTAWFDQGADEGRTRTHEWQHDGVTEFSVMEIIRPDGRRELVERNIEVEFRWIFELDNPVDQQACISALLRTAELLARIAERGVS